jgi:CMP-2-keto-3-deoxyoctulosonic acid synthetase
VVFAGHRVKVDVVEDSFVPGVKTPEDLRRLNAGLGTGLVNDLALTFLVA